MYTPGCSGSRVICSLRSWMAIRYYVAFSFSANTIETTDRHDRAASATHDLHGRDRRAVHAAAAGDHQPVRRLTNSSEYADADRLFDQRRCGVRPRLRTLYLG